MEKRKKISVCAGTYNEEANIREFYGRVLEQLKKFPQYDYELIFIDNFSMDGTRDKLEQICAKNKKIKAIYSSTSRDKSSYYLGAVYSNF